MQAQIKRSARSARSADRCSTDARKDSQNGVSGVWIERDGIKGIWSKASAIGNASCCRLADNGIWQCHPERGWEAVQPGRYDDGFGSATIDRTRTGSQSAEGPDGEAQVQGSQMCNLASLTRSLTRSPEGGVYLQGLFVVLFRILLPRFSLLEFFSFHVFS